MPEATSDVENFTVVRSQQAGSESRALSGALDSSRAVKAMGRRVGEGGS